MHRFLCFLLLVAPYPVVAAEPTTAASLKADAVTPFVDEQTIFIARVALDCLSTDEAQRAFAAVLGGISFEPGDEATALFRETFEKLLEAGINEVFVVAGAADLPESSVLVVLPCLAGTEAAIADFLRSGGMETVERIGEALVAGDREAVDRAKRKRAVDRPELLNAFEAVGDGAVQCIFMPTEEHRCVIEAIAPRLPSWLGGMPTTVVTRGALWAATCLEVTPRPTMRIVVQAQDAQAAESFATVWATLLRWATNDLPKSAQLTSPDLVTRLALKAADDRLTLTLGPGVEQIGALKTAGEALAGRARSAAQRSQSRQNLLTVGLALQEYRDRNAHFPSVASHGPDGRPLLSWRVNVLPFLGETDLYQQFHLDEPWNSEHNLSLIARIPRVLVPPGNSPDELSGSTPYLAPLGEGTGFAVREGLQFDAFRDGTSKTILLVEVDHAHTVVWTKPSDWDLDVDDPTRGLFRDRDGRIQVLFADGHARFLPRDISAETLRALFTRNGDEDVKEF